MEFAWAPLLWGAIIGGIVGSGGKRMVKAAARGYMTIADTAKAWSSHRRQQGRDALEDARSARRRKRDIPEEAARRERAGAARRRPRPRAAAPITSRSK